tara:strand:+ start:274 stop:438 length:165 start_codon:yes stop_codon:yes gene_type:complete
LEGLGAILPTGLGESTVSTILGVKLGLGERKFGLGAPGLGVTTGLGAVKFEKFE